MEFVGCLGDEYIENLAIFVQDGYGSENHPGIRLSLSDGVSLERVDSYRQARWRAEYMSLNLAIIAVKNRVVAYRLCRVVVALAYSASRSTLPFPFYKN